VITLSELKAVLQRLPVPAGKSPLSEAAFDMFLEAMDENHDGVVDYSEFAEWLNHDSGTARALMKNMKAAPEGGPRASSNATARAKPKASPTRAAQGGTGEKTGPQAKSTSRGPERFFYDKSSYTGTHARGGPEHVAVGHGTAHDQSWKRPG